MKESDESEISLNEIIDTIKSVTYYLLRQWWKIIIVAIAGGSFGYFYVSKQPVKYISNLSFLVEEGKSSGGGLASLAGQFGIDIGGSNSGASLFAGDNILMFLKSTSLLKEVLLTPVDANNTHYLLGDKYIEVYFKKAVQSKKINIPFFHSTIKNGNAISQTRMQDSLMHLIIQQISLGELTVERPERKATCINVQVSMQDELLSKYFCERLVSKATERYVQIKVMRQKANVDKLQRKVDSIENLLFNKTVSTAIENEKILDVNPAYKSTTVKAEIVGRDKVMLGTIYAELMKNLELSKFSLSQETPTIQILDNVELPLIKKKKSKVLFAVVASIASAFVISSIFIGVFFIKKKF